MESLTMAESGNIVKVIELFHKFSLGLRLGF